MIHMLKAVITFSALCLCLSRACPALGSELNTESLRKLEFTQNLNSQINLDLSFVDDAGHPVILRDYFGSKPAILMMGYYECPMLCNLVLNGLVQSMSEIKSSGAKDLSVLFVSIDPSETPALASAKKKTYLERYGKLQPGEEWHFLTGKADGIAKLASSLGFQYQYDPSIQQFAHPSGIVILTPAGRISKYMLGIKYNPKSLEQALTAAKEQKIGSPVANFLLLCFFYQPLTGKYSGAIMITIRALAVLIMLGLAGYIVKSLRAKPAQQSKPQPAISNEIPSSS